MRTIHIMRTTALALLLAFSTAVAAQNLEVSTVAGIPGTAGLRDGSAGTAQFNRPTWLDVDRVTGAIYVVDRANNSVRKISRASVATLQVRYGFFDTSLVPFSFGGPFGGGIRAEPFRGGCGGSQYGRGIFLSNSAAHELVLIADHIGATELANRDDISPFITGGFVNPTGIAFSWGYEGSGRTYATDRLYVADTGNHVIRRIRFGLSFEACPQARFIDTLAGVIGQRGAGDGAPSQARFHSPTGLVAAPDGSIYVADTGNHTIRRISADGVVTTVAGIAGVAGFRDGILNESLLNTPSGIDIDDAGDLFIADTSNHVIRKLSGGLLTTVAGTPGVAGHADGPVGSARFSGPVGIRISGDSILVADTSNHVVRSIAPASHRRRAVR